MKDYRVTEERARSMGTRQIVEEVVFAISDDVPDDSNDEEMAVFLQNLNPVVAAVYCAWMSTGHMANGGLFKAYETCCAEMIQRAAYGFRLLGKADVAYAVELSCRAFPSNVIPATRVKRSAGLNAWMDRDDANTETPEQQSLAGLEYKFELADAYDHTDELLRHYRFEFVLSE
ncbi:DUF4375 domain-containing protein [Roseimicrobium sp. ORNL1]|uniref:DMP19 family protein n=1 Tax=Roseimicrobium sp. ORNL1 TaxID=2711231 RepID=UPI0013E1F1E4|nr:DUF4375 domain-containing protein [Roseimicrobium sp. ORNL1]QIF04732.1 hypothetical protein G5S37_25430 [Roseimicrobium sp. ORNL1]